jgi:hypothetical protein
MKIARLGGRLSPAPGQINSDSFGVSAFAPSWENYAKNHLQTVVTSTQVEFALRYQWTPCKDF